MFTMSSRLQICVRNAAARSASFAAASGTGTGRFDKAARYRTCRSTTEALEGTCSTRGHRVIVAATATSRSSKQHIAHAMAAVRVNINLGNNAIASKDCERAA